MAAPPTRDRYTHGHHDSVLRSHRWRTAENSCAYLLPHLRAGDRLLDVGCGPGTISADLAARISPGSVVAVDNAHEIVEVARSEAARRGLCNLEIEVADVYDLPYPEASFDVVHTHQVLQHLSDPVAALREMARVCRPGGLVAAREGDYPGFVWFPADPGLDRWLECYLSVTRANGAEAAAGRRLLSWALAAGLAEVSPSASVWCYATPADRRWWGDLWAERATQSAFAEQALAGGHATPADLQEMAEAWRRWAAAPDGWYLVVHGEILGRPG
ncbi:MAG TPA: methyltransferase domain-containing protein [Acidimicrobiales bacterium]|nr:methyltransferase domain-containing protein [Acidimicrobiales bacterium]